MDHVKPDEIGDTEIPMVAAIPAPLADQIGAGNCIHVCAIAEGDEGITIANSSTTTAAAASQSPRSLPGLLESSAATGTTATSTIQDESILLNESETPPTPAPGPGTPSPPTPSSPSISAIATPEPVQRVPSQTPLRMDQLASPDPSMVASVVTDERHEDCSAIGKWRTTLCSCWSCHLWFTSLPWMACCCNPILIGQLMTRLRLDWCARPNNEAAVRTFGIIVSISFVYLILVAAGVGAFVLPFFVIWIVILATRLRHIMRHHYQIPARTFCPTFWDGLWEDLCCVLWCPCCTTVQMARQTHDEKRYPYECFSPTGLPTYSPGVGVV